MTFKKYDPDVIKSEKELIDIYGIQSRIKKYGRYIMLQTCDGAAIYMLNSRKGVYEIIHREVCTNF